MTVLLRLRAKPLDFLQQCADVRWRMYDKIRVKHLRDVARDVVPLFGRSRIPNVSYLFVARDAAHVPARIRLAHVPWRLRGAL